MKDHVTDSDIGRQVRGVNRRLASRNPEPRNADRSLWASLALRKFAQINGISSDVENDPETVLADLVADLMHWCDVQNSRGRKVIDFESALQRALQNHAVERAGERRREARHKTTF